MGLIPSRSRTDPAGMNRISVQRVGVALLCGVAGYSINALAIGTIAPLLLGRIVTLPIAIVFGPWYGALAAAIGAMPQGGSPSAGALLVLPPIEAFVIGWFARRGKSPLVAGALVWGTVALTLVIAPWLYGVGYLRQTILPIALQATLSGLVAVVVADLLAVGVMAQRQVAGNRPFAGRRLRAYAFHAFVLVATLPLLVLVAADSQLSAAKREADGGARLREAVTALSQHIDEFVASHGNAVQSLATALSDRKPEPADRKSVV